MKKLFFFLFTLSNLILSQSHYLFQHSQSTYEEITDGTISAATGNDGSELVQLPFTFLYNDLPYYINSVRISVNGWISPGTTYNGTGWLNDLGSTSQRPLIAPLWDDLYDDATSEISYKTIGAFPQRIFIVQWKGIRWNGSNGARQNFQVRLFEEDFRIEFIYGQMTQPTSVSASIGLNSILGTTEFVSVTPGNPATISPFVANNSINSIQFLTSGTKYSFTPFLNATGVRIIPFVKKVARGAVNQPIIGIQFSMSGAITPATISRFRFKLGNTTNSSDILNAKVFSTGNNSTFSDEFQFGETLANPPDSFDIVGAQMVGFPTNYFWLTFDIAPNAQIANLLDAACLMVAPVGFPDTTNPAGERVIVEGIGGEFNIGSGMNFSTLTEALAILDTSALKSNYILKLSNSYNSANETFPITLKEINGANRQQGIIIKPDATASPITITSSAAATFDFIRASHFTIIGRRNENDSTKILTIENSSTQGHAIRFDGSSFNNIEYCNLLGRNANTIGGVVHMRSTLSRGSDANRIANCFITRTTAGKPNCGIYFTGGIYPPNLRNEIFNCEITNFHDAGIYLTGGTILTKIIGCEIHHTEPSASSTVYGIRLDNAEAIIARNKIHSLNTSVLTPNSIKGIFIIGSLGSYLRTIINNNFISMTGNFDAPVDGIDFFAYQENSVAIYFNTIYLSGGGFSGHTSSGIKLRASSNNVEIINNIIINKRYNLMTGDGLHYAIYLSNSSGITGMNFNNYYSAGAFHHLGHWNGQNITDLNSWKTTTQFDQNSVSKDLQFVSESDLHLSGSSIGDVDLIATPINNINTDIDNEPRHNFYPYKGADENILFPLPVELVSFSAVYENNVVKLKWKTASEKNNIGFEIEKSIGALHSAVTKWNMIGFVKGNGTTSEMNEYFFEDDVSTLEKKSNTDLNYRLKQIDFDGTSSYSNIFIVNIDMDESAPKEFALHQNFPNPFNPSTVISYQLSASSNVTLKVYDVLGNEVATLVDEYREAGNYNYQFSTDNYQLQSGVYFYQLCAGSFVNAKKLMILK